ncbi:maleylpyruvate isomerase family mycothiol-dependent enzyme [Mycolicibacterium mengxianglii]|uniref:maleylpyruvate isomerase family mycothiol-dependent enzyme n=1 Tax=Mycolicibacterium mengxianglii TaxID=2736649 RepID=UPI0018EECD13|nr:maleylpyruvate isomerase family mycothiol-dependent enzyme [Mycolicibacterium mengxianglii]
MDFAAEFLSENKSFGALIANGDPSAEVPTCPGWNLQQLFRHVGRGNRWAAQMVLEQAGEALDPRAVPDGKPPEGAETQWLDAGGEKLVAAVDQIGGEVPVWTFVGPRPAAWWIRRRLYEVLVHRADAALALGQPFEVSPELAGDAISEWLDIVVHTPTATTALADGHSIHLHATDDGLGDVGEWTLSRQGESVSWRYEHGKGSVALRGAAADLLLALTRRRPRESSDIQTFGDETVWQSWVDHVTF